MAKNPDKFSKTKEFLKMVVFLEFITLILFGCIWLASTFFMKASIDLIVLPAVMTIVFGATLLAEVIQPISEWWFD